MRKSRGALRAVLKAATREQAPRLGAWCHFAFLVRGYSVDFWWWEFVVILRKVLIQVTLVIAPSTSAPALRSLLLLFIMTAATFLHLWCWPYTDGKRHRGDLSAEAEPLTSASSGDQSGPHDEHF